jgi:outer membrane protein assembly factor BamD
MAMKYYEKGQYYKAIPLLEELIPVYRGTERSEQLYYVYAFSDYYLKDYILAAHRFNTFVKTFPFSRYTEECQFMSAICHYKLSPKFSLDQTDTYMAISELELFVHQYPSSGRVDSCHTMLDGLREKLEKKSFMTSKQFYRIEKYKAAVVMLENTLKDYPDTEYREEALFLIMKAHFEWAENSVPSKKAERYNNTKKAYYKFAGSFPDSKFMREANHVMNEVNEELEEMYNNNS